MYNNRKAQSDTLFHGCPGSPWTEGEKFSFFLLHQAQVLSPAMNPCLLPARWRRSPDLETGGLEMSYLLARVLPAKKAQLPLSSKCDMPKSSAPCGAQVWLSGASRGSSVQASRGSGDSPGPPLLPPSRIPAHAAQGTVASTLTAHAFLGLTFFFFCIWPVTS